MNLKDALQNTRGANLLYISICLYREFGQEQDEKQIHENQFPFFIQELATYNPNKNYVIILICKDWNEGSKLPSILLHHRVRCHNGAYFPTQFKNVRFYIVTGFFTCFEMDRHVSDEYVLSSYIEKSIVKDIYISDCTSCPPIAKFPLLTKSMKRNKNVTLLEV